MDVLSTTLKEALDVLGIKERPLLGQGDGDWERAIVLVKRSIPINTYAVCHKDSKGCISITHDLGLKYSCSAIAGITSFYPIPKEATESDNTQEEVEQEEVEQETTTTDVSEEVATEKEVQAEENTEEDDEEDVTSAINDLDEVKKTIDATKRRTGRPRKIAPMPTKRKTGRPRGTK